MTATGRYAARLYAKRRRAIERNVPFWLPGEQSGQDGRNSGQDASSGNSLKLHDGQDGQDGQDGKIATGKNVRTCATWAAVLTWPEAHAASHGPNLCPDHPDHPDQASSGAASSRSGHIVRDLTVLTETRLWTDDRGWIAEILRAEPGEAKLSVLFWWVISAGGWIEGTTAKLPPLPACMASVELPRMLRQHGIATHTNARARRHD